MCVSHSVFFVFAFNKLNAQKITPFHTFQVDEGILPTKDGLGVFATPHARGRHCATLIAGSEMFPSPRLHRS